MIVFFIKHGKTFTFAASLPVFDHYIVLPMGIVHVLAGRPAIDTWGSQDNLQKPRTHR